MVFIYKLFWKEVYIENRSKLIEVKYLGKDVNLSYIIERLYKLFICRYEFFLNGGIMENCIVLRMEGRNSGNCF